MTGVSLLVLVTALGLGFPRKITAEAPSGPPQDVAAVPLSSTTVHVTWNDVLVDETNGVLTDYEVQYEQSTFSEIAQTVSETVAAASSDELTLQGLQEYVEYSVSVRALNADGAGPFSAAVTVTTYQDVPSSTPQSYTLTPTGPTELTLAWTRPPEIDINGVLLFYSLRYHTIDSDDFTLDAVSSDLEDFVLEGLANYTIYEALIGATTVNGTGPFTSQIATTSENVPDSPPQNVTASSPFPDSIRVEWRPPKQAEWNGVLRGYQLRYREIDSSTTLIPSGEWKNINHIPTNQTYYVLQNLQSSTLYCIQVAAMTIGVGPFSSALYISTLESNGLSGSGGSGGAMTSGDGGLGQENVTNTTSPPLPEDDSAAIIAGLVVGGVFVVSSVAALVLVVAAVVWRHRGTSYRVQKSKSLSHYLDNAEDELIFSDPNQSQTYAYNMSNNPQYERTAGPTCVNPSVVNPLSFELETNTAYHVDSTASVVTPTQTSDYRSPTDATTSRSSFGVSDSLPSSVKVADNPRYGQFTTSIAGSVVLSEGDYDYPTSFQRPVALTTSDTGPYSEVRLTSDQESPYTTVK